MNQKRPVRFFLILIVLLSLTLGACQKTKGPKEALDGYLKKIRQDPYSVTLIIADMNKDFRSQIEDLLKEYEYEILEEAEIKNSGSGTERKGYWVRFTGYDIGTYFKEYLESFQIESLAVMARDHSYEELVEMSETDPDGFMELFQTADLEVFTGYMDRCREAGKTYHSEEKQYGIVVYKYPDAKEWVTNPMAIGDHLDMISNGVYTAWKDYKSSIEQ